MTLRAFASDLKRMASSRDVAYGSSKIGLSVTQTEVSGVLVKRERIIRCECVAINEAAELSAAISSVLATLASRHSGSACIAIGSSAAQVKRLKGLPAVSDAKQLHKIIVASDTRFFVRNGAPLLFGGVQPIAVGEAWVAAFDRHIVECLAETCRLAHVSVRAVLPGIIALTQSMSGTCLRQEDGDVTTELHLGEGGRIGDVQRRPTISGRRCTGEPPRPTIALEALGPEATRYAAAYGAALTPMSNPFVLRLQGGAVRPNSYGVARLAAAFLSAVVGLCAWFVAPVLAERRMATIASQRLASISILYRDASAASDSLQFVTKELRELKVFEEGRRSMTVLLSNLTESLSDSVQLLSVRVDSLGGTLTLLSPQSSSTIPQIASIRDIGEVSLASPVALENQGKEERERVTILFRWRKGGADVPRREQLIAEATRK